MLNVGAIWSDIVGLFRAQSKKYIAVALFLIAPAVVLGIASGGMDVYAEQLSYDPTDPSATPPEMPAWLAPVWLLYMFAFSLVSQITSFISLRTRAGEPVELREAMEVGINKLWAWFKTWLAATAGIIGVYFVCALPAVVLLLIPVIGPFVGGVALLLMVVVMARLSVMGGLFIPIVVDTDLSGFAAIRHAWQLTKHSWVRVWGSTLVVGLLFGLMFSVPAWALLAGGWYLGLDALTVAIAPACFVAMALPGMLLGDVIYMRLRDAQAPASPLAGAPVAAPASPYVAHGDLPGPR